MSKDTEGCKGCRYWDVFSWVCSNGESPYVADYVNCGCDKYDRREDRNNDDVIASRKPANNGATA